jgi:DNA-binding transcriptional MerR regulator
MVRLLKLADLGKVLENPFDQIGQSDSLTEEQLMDRTGFRAKQLDALEELGLIRSRRVDEQKVFASGDVQVAVCVSRLSAAGLNRRHGFQFADAVIYVDSLRKLLQTEVELFLAKAEASGEEEDLLGLAAHAIEEVTPLVVALRAKLLREVLESR